MTMFDKVEMGTTLEGLISTVSAIEADAPLFIDAFGGDEVTSELLARALAQFVRALVSMSSPCEVGRAQVADSRVDFPKFSADGNAGKGRFFGEAGCARCHSAVGGADPAKPFSTWTEWAAVGLTRARTLRGPVRLRVTVRTTVHSSHPRCGTLWRVRRACTMDASTRSRRWWITIARACRPTPAWSRGCGGTAQRRSPIERQRSWWPSWRCCRMTASGVIPATWICGWWRNRATMRCGQLRFFRP